MRIGINLLPLRPGKNGGMEIYVRNLLSKLFALDQSIEYYLITAPYNHSSLNFPFSNYKKILLNNEKKYPEKLIRSINRIIGKNYRPDTITLEKIIEHYQFNLWFCPFLSLDPRPIKIPSVVTIPDIQHEYYPENFSATELALRKEYIQPSCELATGVITISNFSKRCIVEKTGSNPEKIHVIYLAAGDIFSDTNISERDIIKKYHLFQEYFFYPANDWPHKNHLSLITAFYLYRTSFNNKIHLVLSGNGVKDNSTIHNLITKYHLQDSVHILDYVEFNDLPGLYKNAKALVFPSLFEGFGIPLIEAMAMNCPVIASESTSIPEVANGAAILFNPEDPHSIADAMHQVVTNDFLRNKNIIKGKIRSTEFSYNIVAQKHLDLFKMLVK